MSKEKETLSINEMSKMAHETAKNKGFWDTDRNRGELLMLIVSELSEALEALRKNHRAKKESYEESSVINKEKYSFETFIKNSFEDELADTFIRLGDLCASENIDIEWYIRKKMQYNKSRPKKHGKAF